MLKKRELLYSGKAKSVYLTEDKDRVILDFRDDTSAFDGKKVSALAGKGIVNNKFNAFINDHLSAEGIPVHFDQVLSDHESIVKRLTMIPVECVVRNFAAGSLTRRLGIDEGAELKPPVFEYFLKNDALGDPMITESHIETFGWARAEQLRQMKDLSFKINEILKKLFDQVDIMLVDFKLEFGEFDGQIMLGDEFTPDGCRLWDKSTHEKMDKDRFRQDLGHVIESYREVSRRLGIFGC